MSNKILQALASVKLVRVQYFDRRRVEARGFLQNGEPDDKIGHVVLTPKQDARWWSPQGLMFKKHKFFIPITSNSLDVKRFLIKHQFMSNENYYDDGEFKTLTYDPEYTGYCLFGPQNKWLIDSGAIKVFFLR